MTKNIVVLGAHPFNGYSMRRYTSLLEDSYRSLGYQVQGRRPTNGLSQLVSDGKLRKYLIYFEKLVLFPLSIVFISRNAVVHVADHSDSIWLLNPMIKNRYKIITCHDLIAIRAARGEISEHKVGTLGRMYQWFIEKGIERGSNIISVSHTTEMDVNRLFSAIPSTVVWNPVDHKIPVSSGVYERTIPNDRYALISAGVNNWRKRRFLAIQVWIELKKVWPKNSLSLHIIGAQLDQNEMGILFRAGINQSSIRILSNLSDEELGKEYGGAEMLIQSSKYEGFAWPVLEANIHGVPALCADEPILRETGEGNIFFDSELVYNNWSLILQELSSQELSARVQARAKSFTVEKFGEDIQDIIVSLDD